MDYLPQDPFMLVSAINMMLRDGEFESLEDLCRSFDRDMDEIKDTLSANGYVYSEKQRQVRPAGYDE